jgi:hypothetical protein
VKQNELVPLQERHEPVARLWLQVSLVAPWRLEPVR